jgi:hypothetical protein
LNGCLERKLFDKPSEVVPGTASQLSSRWLVTTYSPHIVEDNRLTVSDSFAIMQLSHTLPVRTGSEVHLIAGLTGWQVTGADGIPLAKTQWPGVFRIGGKEASGTIRFEGILDLGRFTPSGLPDFAEVREDESALLVAMQQARTADAHRSSEDP